MKLLCFSDIHGSTAALNAVKKKAKKADLLVCAGDFTVFEEGMEMVLQKLNEMGKKVLLIPGNHEDPKLLRQVCKLFDNIIYIHKKTYTKDSYFFIGHGGGGFSPVDKEFESWSKKIRIPKGKKAIFVTHAPPYNTKLDFIWEHRGNKSYRKFIAKRQPILAVSGHFHETQGKEDKIKKTRLINPGPKGKIVQI